MYHYLGNNQMAEKLLRNAVKLDPFSSQTWLVRGNYCSSGYRVEFMVIISIQVQFRNGDGSGRRGAKRNRLPDQGSVHGDD